MIENLSFFEKKYLLENKKEKLIYQGPQFNTLDQEVQLNFYDLFDSLGINNDLAYLIEALSIAKNNILLDKWYNDLQAI